ncbi:hypothetical protein N7492_007517 [Penicillium capsulatum]|uniref:Inheritance of peroxisomes protein 1 n=1 Tax=Penicillium capsulatum TaxID=69766 RepID=A0A9W9LLD1_9EURO|nr:hypothetical protein N7492_007517 [Penicillium capsulatum]KAJ6117351.1 hypothetical protein N7512_007076 [Penicillium capsulatum]
MPESPSESSGPVQSIRRSVTLPTKLNPKSQRGSPAPNSENVIFYHPSAKIVHFAPRALFPIPSSSNPSDFDYPVDTIETLPWRSATERTVATAPLRLEKGLTVFLKCGNVVHAILRNSQCWCVDGASKFVLRIRPLTYYRIEIPNETEDDKALVADLKAALPTVLRYEVTPCPFKRAFTVELPEEAMAPRRKRAWRPKERNGSVPLIFGSIQGSPSEPKSEWMDSASTGEDTDGAATDDSALTPQRTNSTVSEPLAADEHSPASSVVLELPPRQAPIRRSVTETPQTFTSLVAKFDAAPVAERDSSPEPASPTASKVTRSQGPELEARNLSEEQPEPDTKLVREQECIGVDPTPEHHAPNEAPSRDLVSTTKAPLVLASLPEIQTSSEDSLEGQPTSLHQDASEVEVGLESEPESDHDTSFASSPESFHSADLPSPVNSSSHTSPVEFQETYSKDLLPESHTTVAPSAVKVNSSNSTKPPNPDANVSDDYTPSNGIESSTPSEPVPQSARQEIPRPSLTIPSATSTRTSSSVKATSPSTDFNHMSTEFRRRAQATRKRDTSPMPPPSAIYQPAPPPDATSLLSKALTLVLVPPVSLFIVLLHIAARIVVSPPVHPAFEDKVPGARSSSKDAVNEDDFSFPLEREVSSEYEDARITKKLDPWDLD